MTQDTMDDTQAKQDWTDGLEAAPFLEAHRGDLVASPARPSGVEQDQLLADGARGAEQTAA